ncbi:hypothetical protein MMC25_001567 [Agyrium rufum]|nr:hypothetical protein [Agyrium rufum]
MLFGCFSLSALDLLSALEEKTTAAERRGYVDWIYHCQHSQGGFRGFTGTIIRYGDKDERVKCDWDPANVAGTLFALSALGILKDDFKRVERDACLAWLHKLQWDDGSFSESLGEGGRREGPRDIRQTFLALLVRQILKGGDRVASEGDIDTNTASRFAQRCLAALVSPLVTKRTVRNASSQVLPDERKTQTHRGIQTAAGSTYCAIGALKLLGSLQSMSSNHQFPMLGSVTSANNRVDISAERLSDLVRWLVYRQVYYEEEAEEEEDEEEDEDEESIDPGGDQAEETSQSYCNEDHSVPSAPTSMPMNSAYSIPASESPIKFTLEELQFAGLNGRCGKSADTCYSFWAGGALGVLGLSDLIDSHANRNFLLEKTQHVIGGFGKLPGDPPDILHSYLALASLSLTGEPRLKELDPLFCVSTSVREYMDALKWDENGELVTMTDSSQIKDISKNMHYISIGGG